MKMPTLPTLLSFNAGYLDTAGFLALHGLFTAHVTGNFVTLGASFLTGTSGAIGKLLALPVFCIVVALARLFRYKLIQMGRPVLRTLFLIKLILLTVGAFLAVAYGPFPTGDSAAAIATGMAFVAAMAIQNAAQRVHLAYAPPTTLMTGTTTQLMLDIADRIHGVPSAEMDVIKKRMPRMLIAVCSFAVGCGLAAVLLRFIGVNCFIVAPIVALIAFFHRETVAES
jgi:uncharacterized membrane protein YoaK (UPF0700 family)